MEINIGTEMRDEYLSLELAKGAYVLAKEVMLIKPNESVIVTGDTSSDKRVIDAVADAVYAIGGVPIVVNYATAPVAFQQPPAPIAAAVSKADVWIEFAYSTIMHSEAFQKSMESGARYINLTGMDVTMMVNTISKVDYITMVEFGEYLKSVLEKTDEIIVASPNGTNLKSYNKGRGIKHSGQLATQKGFPIMLGGQVSWCPIETSINGTLVFDGAVFPPKELGALNSPINLTVKDGRITKIEGGKEANIFSNWINGFDDPNMLRLAHYSMGFNPGVTKITGRIVEDERVFGSIEFGFGSQGATMMGEFWNAASHTDGIVLNPTLTFDGQIFEKDGMFVDEKAIEFCKKLGVAGY